jgi:hypothetical protein
MTNPTPPHELALRARPHLRLLCVAVAACVALIALLSRTPVWVACVRGALTGAAMALLAEAGLWAVERARRAELRARAPSARPRGRS